MTAEDSFIHSQKASFCTKGISSNSVGKPLGDAFPGPEQNFGSATKSIFLNIRVLQSSSEKLKQLRLEQMRELILLIPETIVKLLFI